MIFITKVEKNESMSLVNTTLRDFNKLVNERLRFTITEMCIPIIIRELPAFSFSWWTFTFENRSGKTDLEVENRSGNTALRDQRKASGPRGDLSRYVSDNLLREEN